jgi:hypothetical protein
MAELRHAFQSTVPEGPDPLQVRSSNWNEGHIGLEWHRSGADHTNSTVTPTNVAGMAFPIAANEFVNFVALVSAFAAAANTGLRLRATGPASPATVTLTALTPASASAVIALGAAAFGADLLGTGSSSTTLPGLTIVHGFIANGPNAGTVQLQAGSEVAGSLVTVRAGALLVVFR